MQTAMRAYSWGLIALVIAAALLYGYRLADAPIHVHYDEVLFGLEADAIARTGRDTNGRTLPLYFQVDTNVWYQPIAIYFSALVLKVLPLSDSAIRLPTVLVGLGNIVLMYFVGRRIFRRESLALLAAALLVLTPAHLIHSRVAVDYLYPLPFILVWALCLLAYSERRKTWLLWVATMSLGLGFYSYIASVVMMPIYLGITWWFLQSEKAGLRAYAITAAGFALPLLLIPPFLLAYPDIVNDFQARYRLGGTGPQLDPLQSLRAAVNSRTLADRSNLYYNFFSPGFLFVSGGSNVTNSTREAGVFLGFFAVFLLAGLYDVVTRWSREKGLVVLGFFTAPLAACLILENYAIDRALALLPFGVLLATLGIDRLWLAKGSGLANRLIAPLGVALALVGLGYSAWTLSARGTIGASSPALIVFGLLVIVTGRRIERSGRWWPAVALMLALSVAQYFYFYRDYLGDYGPRSAAWYGNNIQGAVERTIALDGERPAPKVLLSRDIRHIDSYWQFYLRVHNREDLLPKGEMFSFDNTDIAALPADTLLVCLVDDAKAKALVDGGQLSVAGVATDPNDYYSSLGPGEHVTFVIYRRVASPAF
jgi:4-amino-4-deoxy-L-arabinose transferase-like glycosyltransferase